MATQTAHRYFTDGSFDSNTFIREMQDKTPDKIQAMYREVLADFVVETRREVESLVQGRSDTLEALRRAEHTVARLEYTKQSDQVRRKAKKLLVEIDSLLARQRTVVLHWEKMSNSFGVSVAEIADRIGIPEGSTFRTLFPQLFTE